MYHMIMNMHDIVIVASSKYYE